MKKFFNTRIRVVLVVAALAALITHGIYYPAPRKRFSHEQCGIHCHDSG